MRSRNNGTNRCRSGNFSRLTRRRLIAFFPLFCLLSFASGVSASDELTLTNLETQVRKVVEQATPAVAAVVDRRSTFSAVVVSEDGYMLSAGHAVEPGKKYRVVLGDGRTASAKGLGSNGSVDCAMLKITDEGKWPFLELGDSTNLQKYQPCISISHPGRFDKRRGPVVRFGYVYDPLTNRGMVRTTTKMEPGDSGGPLLDLQGRVIGIHSNIRVPLEQNYEVPIDAFKKYWQQLKATKRFEVDSWPSLPTVGLQVQANDTDDGLQVTRVDEDGAAERSGLRLNDEILSVGGRRVTSNAQLKTVFRSLATESRLEFPVAIRRDEATLKLTIDLTDRSQGDDVWPQLASPEQEFKTLEAELDDFVFQIRSQQQGEDREVLATHVRGQSGNLISKSSRVGESPEVLISGRWVPAKVVRRDKENDLVLLSAPLPANGIDLNYLPGDMQQLPGKFLLTPEVKGAGQISVWGSNYFQVRETRRSGYLGVRLGGSESEVVLEQVFKRDAAGKAGLQVGDVLLKINDQPIKNRDDVLSFLRKTNARDNIKLNVLREGKELEKQVTLGRRPSSTRHAADRLPGGKSERRDGFQLVVSHDADVRPETCGSPVFDLQGDFLGINMARNSRTRVYILPKSILQRFVQK